MHLRRTTTRIALRPSRKAKSIARPAVTTRSRGLSPLSLNSWGVKSASVFASLVSTPLDAHNVRRALRKIAEDARVILDTPRDAAQLGLATVRLRCPPGGSSPAWSATAGRRSPKPSTASRSAPSSCKELRRWSLSSPGSHSPMRKGATLASDTLIDQRKPGRDDRI